MEIRNKQVNISNVQIVSTLFIYLFIYFKLEADSRIMCRLSGIHSYFCPSVRPSIRPSDRSFVR